jgi:hypothetical protein
MDVLQSVPLMTRDKDIEVRNSQMSSFCGEHFVNVRGVRSSQIAAGSRQQGRSNLQWRSKQATCGTSKEHCGAVSII